MRYVVNLLAALGLFYSGFVHTFWGNDPYLGWAITIIAAFIMAEPVLAVMDRVGLTGRPAPALGRYWYLAVGVVGVARGWGASRENRNDAG